MKQLAAALAAAAAAGLAWAHPTIVFGELTVDPAPPRAGEPLAIEFTLHTPTDAPVEAAHVLLEAQWRPFEPQPRGGSDAAQEEDSSEAAPAQLPELPADAVIAERAFEEVAPARYRTEVTLRYDGPWTITLRDRTYRQEETHATLTLQVGPEGTRDAISFLFPPTAVGPQSLTTWLVWLIGVPLLAGVVVTLLVLRGGGNVAESERESEAEVDR